MLTKSNSEDRLATQRDRQPFVSIVAPAYNEASIIEKNLSELCQYMQSLEAEYDWEVIVVNDGSKDETRERAEAFAQTQNNVHVLHHRVNFGLGQALKYGFSHCRGDYIVVVDLDLSYATHHIGELLTRIRETGARVVVASPYMKGGSISNVPWLRKTLSIWGNRFLSIAAKRSLVTLTGMVRVYDARFLKSLTLKSMGMGINPEIIHKAMLLQARIEEIPAHLKWRTQEAKQVRRNSSMKILRHTWAILFSGFLLRPVMFFIIPSFVLFLLSLYANGWAMLQCWMNYQQMTQDQHFPNLNEIIAVSFSQAPHAFIIGGMTLMLAIQLFSLGILAVQSKSYFEENFYLSTAIYKAMQEDKSSIHLSVDYSKDTARNS